MKKVICAKDMEAFKKEGKTIFYIDADTILTPSAKDAAKAAGITIQEGSEPAASPCQTVCQPETVACSGQEPEITSDMIYKVLKTMLEKGMDLSGLAGQICPDLPYTSEKRSGVKLVRGQSAKMEPLDVGVPGAKVSFREILGKDEAKTSSGFLEIENAQFDWELAYEETDYVVEGTMTITVDGQTMTAKAGDMFFLPKGSKVVMGSPDRARIFYVTYPAL